MKATLIAFMLGCVLTLVVSSPATTHALETLKISFIYEYEIDPMTGLPVKDPITGLPVVKDVKIDPANKGVVLSKSVCRLDDPTLDDSRAGVAASCATDPPGGRLGQAVLQLTYAPGGVRRLFNLVGIKVDQGPLSVGIQYGGGIGEGTIGVFRDWPAGEWPLTDSTGIDRVTLECASDSFPKCMSLKGLHERIRVASLTLELDPDPTTAEPAASVRFVVLGDTGTIGSGDPEDDQKAVAAALEE
jgi:hypothetical protein